MRYRLVTYLLLLSGFFFTSALAATLSAPILFTGTPVVTGDSVFVSWFPVEGAVEYRVYQNGKHIGSTPVPPYMTPLPDNSGIYAYEVTALDNAGVESIKSAPGKVNIVRVGKVDSVIADLGNDLSSFFIIWTNVPEAIGYRVYRANEDGNIQLIASPNINAYRDTGVAPGVLYTYSITGLDSFGNEGPQSDTIEITIDPDKAAALARELSTAEQKKQVTGRLMNVEEVLSIGEVNNRRLRYVSYLGENDDGGIFVISEKEKTIYEFDDKGKLIDTIEPAVLRKGGSDFSPHKLDEGPDGSLYISDVKRGQIACIGPDRNMKWRTKVKAPPPDWKEIWKGFPSYYNKFSPTPSSILCLSNEIWVTDQRFQLIYRFSYDGDSLGFVQHYHKDGKRWRFPVLGELEDIGENRILVTFPLMRKAVILDSRQNVLFEIGTLRIRDLNDIGRKPVEGFLGVHGVNWVGGKYLMLTDPSVGNIQVYDATDGDYLFHLSWKDTGRLLKLRRANMADTAADGRIWVYIAGEGRIAVLQPVEDLFTVGEKW